MINKIIKILWFCIVSSSLTSMATASPAFIASTGFNRLGSDTYLILRKAYEKLGIRLKIVIMPGERALIEANKGVKVDASYLRVAGMSKIYPNLIRITEAVSTAQEGVFSKRYNFVVRGKESLKPYLIGIRRGHKSAEMLTQGFKVTPLGTTEQLYQLLDRGRGDLVVDNYAAGAVTIKTLGFNLQRLEPILYSQKLYHYIHKKHAHIAHKLSHAIRDVKEELAASEKASVTGM